MPFGVKNEAPGWPPELDPKTFSAPFTGSPPMLVHVFVAEFHQRPPSSLSGGSVVEGMSVGVAE
jgi:hypothetical protein